MFKCDKTQFDKNELARIFLYKSFDILSDFGIKKVVAKSATYEIDTSNYSSVSALSDALTQRDFDVIEIYRRDSLCAINTDNIESITISNDIIEVNSVSLNYQFEKEDF